jgi:diaminohydroxyphosphoribosylaminopyrimidine deaminase/5-amino-6-(5-phosphoribosylamino)uracil reductase
VGCVLVRQDTNEIIGSGFHPKAGWPHAEAFALLEAAGHLDSGVEAAKSILDDGVIDEQLQGLVTTYTSEGGPETLFSEAFKSIPVTAYVTLEPCCHHGQTPPCAASLVLSNVNRVVVGFRDPNPRVNGGGVKLLQEAGIEVDSVLEVTPSDILMKSGRFDSHIECAQLADGFVKRITPKDYDASDYSSWINGAKRSALRRLAGIKKNQDTLTTINWTAKHEKAGDEEAVDQLALDPRWMERVDALLWEDEMINLRLNKAVGKKKLSRRLGERIAKEFGAHVAQTVGHTALLYRPGLPPVLDLDQLVEEGRGDGGDEEEEQEEEEQEEQ